MSGVFLGFSVIGVIMVLGAVVGLVNKELAVTIQRGVTPLVYYVTVPCLLILLMAEADIRRVAGVYTPIALGSALLTAALFAVYARFRGRTKQEIATGAMGASYVNAANVGVPIALYAVGDASPAASVLFGQLLVLAPVFLTIFQLLRETRLPGHLFVRTLRAVINPATTGVVIGTIISLLGVEMSPFVWEPLTRVGEATVPLLLIVFGISLTQEKPFSDRKLILDVSTAIVFKLVLMPLIAWFIAGPIMGLEGLELLGAVIMAALPTAQNAFLYSFKNGMPTTLLKDTILGSSLLSFPIILGIAVLLG